ncbi:MAG: amidohydrolase family protein [Saprospiraceae bacterium]
MKRLLLIALVCTLQVAALTAQTTYLHCGRLLTMNGDAPVEQATLVVEKGWITRIEKGYAKAPEGATTVNLTNKTVLPGLIDCHVHLETEQSRQSYTEKYTLNPADIAFRATGYAQKTLLAGFTTVRDLGGTGVNLALRNAINQGLVQGPHIICAGKMISITGGHGDPTNGAREDLFDPPLPAGGVADGPDECRKAVREQVQRGADCIKVAATGGVLSLARDGKLPHYAEDELQAVVRTARDLGVDVAAHAHGDEGIRRASHAGVRSIEHGTFMSDETISAMVKNGTWYVPTLTAGWAVSDSAQYAKGFFPDMVRDKALGIGPKIEETAGRAYRKGVRIAFGTDAGVFPHGLNALEFGFLSRAGMPNDAILKAATIHAAEMLRIQETTGSLAPGKRADIIAVEGDPLKDIGVMQKVQWVMKAGVVYKN